jgi:hypothetical protein
MNDIAKLNGHLIETNMILGGMLLLAGAAVAVLCRRIDRLERELGDADRERMNTPLLRNRISDYDTLRN